MVKQGSKADLYLHYVGGKNSIFTAYWIKKTGLQKNNSALQVSAFNAKVDAELHHGDESSIKWTDTSSEPPFIVGEPVSPV